MNGGANEITRANAGGRRQLPMRRHGTARIAQFRRWAEPVVTVNLAKLEHLYPLTTPIFRTGNGQSRLCRQTNSEWPPSLSWQPVLQQPQ
jgi:hypothetical protein